MVPYPLVIMMGQVIFRKGVAHILSNILYGDIRETCNACKLFNNVGGDNSMTMVCYLDHLGKRYRAMVNTDACIKSCEVHFTKIDLSQLMGHSGPFEIFNVNLLFHLEDLMDVSEMVKCIDVLRNLGQVPFTNFDKTRRSRPGNRLACKEIQVLGAVSGSMCAIIIGHDGPAEEKGVYLSVSDSFTVSLRL